MSEATRAVFLSYASQDAGTAKRICESLRAAGVEVWFDQSELRGGDAWDQKIRRQIRDCTLFIPIISANTQARTEGYFRLEWRLADQRTHLMAKGRPFVVPVVIDETKDSEAHVPDSFVEVQWTPLRFTSPAGQARLPDVPANERFAARIGEILAGSGSEGQAPTRPRERNEDGRETVPPSRRRSAVFAVAAALLLLALGGWYWNAIRAPKSAVGNEGIAARPPEKSVAVLSFASLSDDKENEYFADGVAEELSAVLGKIPGLTVVGGASTRAFKDSKMAPGEIAGQLHVAYLVNGSVRAGGSSLRIVASVVRASDGVQVWGDSFDRDPRNILAIQDEIAALIAQNLALKIAPRPQAKQVDPEAFALYLQGRQAWNLRTIDGFDRGEQLFNRAIELDPSFARAHAGLADVRLLRATTMVSLGGFDQRNSDLFRKIVADINVALTLDPDCAEAHVSLAIAYRQNWQLREAEREARTAISQNPNYAGAHQTLARILAADGRLDEALAEMKLATQLDPFSSRILDNYGSFLWFAGRLAESDSALGKAIELNPQNQQAIVVSAVNLALSGSRAEALARLRGLGELTPINDASAGIAFGLLGMTAESEARLSRAPAGLMRGYIFLSLGRSAEALAALEVSSARIDDVVELLFEPMWDPLRDTPHFKQLLASLGLAEANARAQAWRNAHSPQMAK